MWSSGVAFMGYVYSVDGVNTSNYTSTIDGNLSINITSFSEHSYRVHTTTTTSPTTTLVGGGGGSSGSGTTTTILTVIPAYPSREGGDSYSMGVGVGILIVLWLIIYKIIRYIQKNI